MGSVNLFIKTVVAISFMWCVAEMALSDNSFQKYFSFIYGLVVISLILSVFTSINPGEIFAQAQGVNASQYNRDYLKNVYESEIENLLREKFGDKDIEVYLDNEYKIRDINCADNKTYEDIMRYLNE